MRSIRRTLRVHLLLGLALLGLLLGGGLYLQARRLLVSQFDAAAEDKARVLATLVKLEAADRLSVDFAEEPMPEFERERAPEYFQIWLAGNDVLARSGSLGRGDLPRAAVAAGGLAFWDLLLPDGRKGRAVGLRFKPKIDEEWRLGTGSSAAAAPPGPVLLVVARDRAALDGALRAVSSAIVVTNLLALLGVAVVVTSLVGRGLAPLARVADQAATIDASSLQGRFPENDVPEELAVICRQLNSLLARIAASFSREQRFTADVAHELRTPIAELRSLAEVASRWPEAAVAASYNRDVLDVALQMERLVATLLTLVSAQSGRQEVECEAVDVAEALLEAWQPLESQARTRNLAVHLPAGGSVVVDSDPVLLSSIIGNLLSNAVEYTPEGGRIDCRVEGAGHAAILTMDNTTKNLTRADLPHLFEPFWRKDAARSDRSHAGLGLALVATLAPLAGARVEAELTDPGTVRFTLRFGAAGSAQE